MGEYIERKNGKDVTNSGSDTPKYKGQRYREDTPSFESLENNPGQGIRGIKVYKSGQEDYNREAAHRKWAEGGKRKSVEDKKR